MSVATVAAIPSGLIFQQPYTAGRVVYNTPAVTLPAAVGPATPTKTGLATVNTVWYSAPQALAACLLQ